jgi:hypothetical protein
VPPVQAADDGERDVLQRVDRGVLERRVVEGRDVPDGHPGDVGRDGEGGGGERARRLLQALHAPGDGAQDHPCEAEDEQDRHEVEQDEVLDHVHHEELLAEPVDRRHQGGEHEDEAAHEADQPPSRCGVRPSLAADRAPPADVEEPEDRREGDHAGRERPRIVRGHCARFSQSSSHPRRAGGQCPVHALPSPVRPGGPVRAAGLRGVPRAASVRGAGAVRGLPAGTALAGRASLPALRAPGALPAMPGAAGGLRRGLGAARARGSGA